MILRSLRIVATPYLIGRISDASRENIYIGNAVVDLRLQLDSHVQIHIYNISTRIYNVCIHVVYVSCCAYVSLVITRRHIYTR